MDFQRIQDQDYSFSSEEDDKNQEYDHRALGKLIKFSDSSSLSIDGLPSISREPSLLDHEDFQDLQMLQESITQLTTLEEEVDKQILIQINNQFTQKLEAFTSQLYSKLNSKNKEFAKFKEALKSFRIYFPLIDKEIEDKKKIMNDKRSGNQIRKQASIIDDHRRSGQEIRQVIYDSNFSPFFLSFNPINLYIILPSNRYASRVLDLLDEHLRNQKDKYYIKQVIQKPINNICQRILEVQIQEGKVQFDVKSGNKEDDMDRMHYQILQVYASLSDQFRRVCAFLAYWANQRRLLGNLCLTEKGLYFMVIEFFQLLGLLPNIFTNHYFFWSEEKTRRMQDILHQAKNSSINFKVLEKYFNDNDYYIMRRKNMKKMDSFSEKYVLDVIFFQFPKPEDIEQVKQKWKEQQLFFNNKRVSVSTLGSLVSSFFHSFANPQSVKSRRVMAIDGAQSNPFKQEIGYYMLDPVYKMANILPQLKVKIQKDFMKSEFERVKEEFERAYDMIKSGKFDNLCDKYIGQS